MHIGIHVPTLPGNCAGLREAVCTRKHKKLQRGHRGHSSHPFSSTILGDLGAKPISSKFMFRVRLIVLAILSLGI